MGSVGYEEVEIACPGCGQARAVTLRDFGVGQGRSTVARVTDHGCANGCDVRKETVSLAVRRCPKCGRELRERRPAEVSLSEAERDLVCSADGVVGSTS